MISKTIRFSPSAAFSIALLIILSGCAGSDLKTRSLSQLPKTNTFTCADRAITGSYTVLDAKACKTYLGRDVRAKGYQPIHITLTNNSNRTLFLDATSISLPVIPADKAAKLAHINTEAHVAGSIALGSVGVPITGAALLMTICVVAGSLPINLLITLPAVVGGVFMIKESVVTAKDALKRNANITAMFESQSLKNQYLSPHSTASGLVFVSKKDFNSNFEIMLTDSTNQKLVLATHN